MSFITPQPYISYKHVSAKTPEALELVMLAISVKSKSPAEFTPPSFNGGMWHSWYLYDWSQDVMPKDKLALGNGE